MKSASSRLLTLWVHFSSILGIFIEAGEALGVRENSPSNLKTLTPQFFLSYGSKRTEVRYGPFTVDGMMKNNGMNGMSCRNIETWNLSLKFC